VQSRRLVWRPAAVRLLVLESLRLLVYCTSIDDVPGRVDAIRALFDARQFAFDAKRSRLGRAGLRAEQTRVQRCEERSIDNVSNDNSGRHATMSGDVPCNGRRTAAASAKAAAAASCYKQKTQSKF
jgi:hypothetical protein